MAIFNNKERDNRNIMAADNTLGSSNRIVAETKFKGEKMSVNSQEVTQAPGNNTVFQTWVLKGDKKACKEGFAKLCALVVNLNKTAKVRFGANENVNCVLGVGHDAWKKLEISKELPKFARLADETQGFKYHDGRAIIGFVDGTENPDGEDRDLFAKVDKEDAKFKGGSYVFVQKYFHKMQEWNATSVSEQEKVIGRSKEYDIEMDESVKPTNSHSAAANVGDDKKVVRGNMPFTEGSKTGTYFIAYASTFSTVELMLKKMFIGEPKGNSDRLLDFSTPVTGALFFAPTLDMLGDYEG